MTINSQVWEDLYYNIGGKKQKIFKKGGYASLKEEVINKTGLITSYV
jgi:hypothetical protein